MSWEFARKVKLHIAGWISSYTSQIHKLQRVLMLMLLHGDWGKSGLMSMLLHGHSGETFLICNSGGGII